MNTGFEEWNLPDLKGFIEGEQDELRRLNSDLYNREWELRRAIWELEQRLKRLPKKEV